MTGLMLSFNKYGERLMTKRNAALDASFWINGYRSGILDFLLSYFTVFVPSVVVEELGRLATKRGERP